MQGCEAHAYKCPKYAKKLNVLMVLAHTTITQLEQIQTQMYWLKYAPKTDWQNSVSQPMRKEIEVECLLSQA